MKDYVEPHVGDDFVPFARHSSTSREAAESMRDVAGGYEAKVLDFIRSRDHYGATADECLVQLGLTHQNGSARVSTLAQKGLIIRSYRKRITRSGRKAFVYVAAGYEKEGVDG
jgi:hypothetical protein